MLSCWKGGGSLTCRRRGAVVTFPLAESTSSAPTRRCASHPIPLPCDDVLDRQGIVPRLESAAPLIYAGAAAWSGEALPPVPDDRRETSAYLLRASGARAGTASKRSARNDAQGPPSDLTALSAALSTSRVHPHHGGRLRRPQRAERRCSRQGRKRHRAKDHFLASSPRVRSRSPPPRRGLDPGRGASLRPGSRHRALIRRTRAGGPLFDDPLT